MHFAGRRRRGADTDHSHAEAALRGHVASEYAQRHGVRARATPVCVVNEPGLSLRSVPWETGSLAA
eukprot:9950168-Alexandrium_andersonii.AAC.1